MLDKFTLSLLNIICESSTPFSYKVFSIDYLTEQARKDLSCDNDMVLEGLNYLFERDYINVKYQDEKLLTSICDNFSVVQKINFVRKF